MTISAAALFELEEALSAPLFQGVPLGSTLGDIFLIELFIGQGRLGYRAIMSDIGRSFYYYLLGVRFASQPILLGKGKILVTWLHDRPHLNEMVLPVVKGLGPDRCAVLGSKASMKGQLPSGTGFLPLAGVPRINLGVWRREYRRSALVWHNKLTAVLSRRGISQFIVPHLTCMMLAQSQKVMAYGQLLDQLQPAAVVTEYDRNIHSSCLILAAKVRGIPTMTMIHGVINPPYGYTPLLADLAFCWGEQQRQQLLAMGATAERLVVTGCQRLHRFLDVNPGAVKKTLGFSGNKPLVLLATIPIQPNLRRELARVFCEGVSGQPLMAGLVRLHPSEVLDLYSREIASFPGIRFSSNQELSSDEALAAAEVVVTHNSGFGYEALFKGKIVIILDVIPSPLSSAQDLIEKAGCPVVRNSQELSNLLSKIFTHQTYREGLRKQADSFVKYFCGAFGDEATNNITSIITMKVTDRRSKQNKTRNVFFTACGGEGGNSAIVESNQGFAE